MTTLDETLLGDARQLRDRLLDLQHDVERARADYGHLVRRLHAAGGSLREIADALGLSHQRVHQIVESSPVDVAPEPRRRHATRGRGRFTRAARQAVAAATAAAKELGHGRVGTEHILLGLVATPAGGAAAALASVGVTAERVREAIAVERAEYPASRRRLLFTPKAQHALERAPAEAQRLGSRWVGTEHVLLGLLDEREGLAAELLPRLGAPEAAVRAAVLAQLAR